MDCLIRLRLCAYSIDPLPLRAGLSAIPATWWNDHVHPFDAPQAALGSLKPRASAVLERDWLISLVGYSRQTSPRLNSVRLYALRKTDIRLAGSLSAVSAPPIYSAVLT
jgi:hypothetical protein